MSRDKSILVVYDDPMIRMFITCVLVDAGFSVEEAADGRAALDRTAESTYDLIVLDLQMPGMDGWTFLQSCTRRGDHRTQVIACTARSGHDPHVTRLPVDGFLQEPFRMLDLCAAAEHCALRR